MCVGYVYILCFFYIFLVWREPRNALNSARSTGHWLEGIIHFHLLLCVYCAAAVNQVKVPSGGGVASNSPWHVLSLPSRQYYLDLACLSSTSRLVTSWQSVRPASGGSVFRRFRRRHLPQVDLFSLSFSYRPPKKGDNR